MTKTSTISLPKSEIHFRSLHILIPFNISALLFHGCSRQYIIRVFATANSFTMLDPKQTTISFVLKKCVKMEKPR
jgi:hypothetical protein